MSACVLPQGDNTLTTPVPLKNRPPRFVEENLRTTLSAPNGNHNRLLTANNSATCQITFSIRPSGVDDPDWCDALQVQWYVDYQDAAPDPSSIRQTNIVLSPPDPSTPRDLGSTDFTLKTSAFNNPAFSPLPEFGAHVVEALVTDGTVSVSSAGRTTPPRPFLQPCFPPAVTLLPDGGVPSDPTFFTTYAWTLVIDQTATCPVSQ